MREKWMKIVSQMVGDLDNAHQIECPNCKKEAIDYLYIGDEKTRVGYVQIWCNACLKGVYISRAIAPINAKFKTFEEDIKDIVPQYEFIED